MKALCGLFALSLGLLLGCTSTPEPPAKPKAEAKQPPAKPKVEPTKATLTPGMKAALKADEAGNYREAARLYIVELAAEEAKPAPS